MYLGDLTDQQGSTYSLATSTTTVLPHPKYLAGQQDSECSLTSIRVSTAKQPAHLRLWPLIPLTAFASVLCLLTYLVVRVYFLVLATSQWHAKFAWAWIFYSIELLIVGPNVLTLGVRCLVFQKPLSRLKLYVTGAKVPSVDVYIPCCNEPADVVINTVRAACSLDYPTECLRIFLLDDGRSKELENAMQIIKEEYPFTYYTARPKPPIPNFKAGNINCGLVFSDTMLPGSPAELVAGIDADMIVDKHWLRTAIPHFLQNEKVGMTCFPQNFYNIPKNDPLREDLDTIFHIDDTLQTCLGFGICTGTGWVVRREALDSVGGFPEDVVSEDTTCSAMLQGAGWEVLSIHEVIQHGIQPDTLLGHLKQRTRWSLGNIQLGLKMKFRCFGPLNAKLQPLQRFVGLAIDLNAWTNIVNIVAFPGLAALLLSGAPAIIYQQKAQLIWLLRFACLSVFADFIHKCSLLLVADYRTAFRTSESDFWQIPFFATSIVPALLTKRSHASASRFWKTSGPGIATLKERGKDHGGPFFLRIKAYILEGMLWFHVLIIFAFLFGFILDVMRATGLRDEIRSVWQTTDFTNEKPEIRWLFYILTTIGWPPLIWLVVLWSMWTPVGYMLCPPKDEPREEHLTLDKGTGVYYPTDKARKGTEFTPLGRPSDHLSVSIFVYSVVCFIGSWYL